MKPLVRHVSLAVVLTWFIVGGFAHFFSADAFASIVPPYIPYARAVVFISGVFELLGATGMVFKGTRRWAAWGLIALTLAVTPANVFMWQHAEQFPNVPAWMLFWRLPLQAALLAVIAIAGGLIPARDEKRSA